MKNLKLILFALLLCLPIYAFAQTTTQQSYENLDNPVDLLASYYDAINHQEYQHAYGYWQSAPRTYNDFVQGFSDTSNVQLIVQPPTRIGIAAGSSYVAIPTVLIADHINGTQHTYAGCFITRKTNPQLPDPAPEDPWHLYDAELTEITGAVNIPVLLAEACEDYQG